MSNENYDYEYLAIIAKSIQEHAIPRPYDYDILHVAVTGVFVSALVAVAAFWLNYRQISIANEQKNIAKKQSDISLEQTEIAKKQADIMEQQNKIALFKDKYELYISLMSVYSACKTISENFDLFLSNLKNDCQKYNNTLVESESLYLFSSIFVYKGDSSNYIELISNDEKCAKNTASKETINFIKNFNKIFFIYNISQSDINEIANILLKVKHINETLQENTRCNMLDEIKEVLKLISESKFYPNMATELKIK